MTEAIATQSASAALAPPGITADAPNGAPPINQVVAPAAPEWLKGADETTVGYAQNKGWTEPKQVLDGYRNLEKLMGADKAGQTVVVPKDGASPEETAAFYNRLGRPADAAGYKLPVPDGADPAFSKVAAEQFHKLGLTAKQGESLTAWWNETAGSAKAQTDGAKQAQFEADAQSLRTEWGAAFEQNKVAASAAARGLGLDAPTIDKLESAMGHKGVMDFFYKIGAKMGEGSFVTGEKTESFGNAMTPGQAKARIAERMSDKSWTADYIGGNKEKLAEMTRLQGFAFPPEARA